MNLKVKFNHADYSDEQLDASIVRILNDTKLCSMATIKGGTESYINTAYFCYSNSLEFYILTEPTTQHSINVAANASIALTIFDSNQEWGTDLKGLQIFGECEMASGTKVIEGTALYLKRFADFGKWIKHPGDFAKGIIKSKLYIIRTKWLKLFDESTFGKENFITLTVEAK